jgi:predicted ATPase
MLELDSKPKMVGRKKKIKKLRAHLDKAAEGQGNTVLLSGEAGVGKTRLVDEVKGAAEDKGFHILSGNSAYESLTPYMPFIEALRSGNLESLFGEEAPKVEAVFLVTNTGLLIREVLREESDLDSELFASMLTTVGNFVEESLSMLRGEESMDTLNRLGYGEYLILIETGISTNLVVIITGDENEFLINDMREVLSKVSRTYGDVLHEWDGDEEKVRGIEHILEPLVISGKYDGVYYGEEDPETRRNLLFENVSLGLMRHAQTTPVLLCLEDLQWADPSTLALTHYIARNTRKCGLLILGTYRPEDVTTREGKPHPLVETMQLMSREDLYEGIELGRLSLGNMSEFFSSLFGTYDFSDEFKNRIHKETEGNPLFIIELMKLLVEEGIVKRDNGTWKLSKALEDVNIPSKICDVIARRLNRLERDDRKVLDYASVMGDVFTSRVLAEALDVKRIHLLEQLRVIEQTHKLIRSYNGTYKFDHAKVKEVLYDEIPQELRMEYHALIAYSIEELNRDNLDDVLGDLAFHYYHCKNRQKALLYKLKTAEKAERTYSNEEAIRFYTEALEFEESPEKRMEIFENLGNVYKLVGFYDKSIESFQSALDLSKSKRKKAEITARIGDIYEEKGEYDESIRIANEALDLVKGKKCKEEAYALNLIGTVNYCRGEYDEAIKYLEKSLKIRKKIDDSSGIASSVNNIANVHLRRGEYDEAIEYYEESLKIRKESEDQRNVARSLGNIGAVYLHTGEYDEALENFGRSLEILEKIGDQQGIGYALNNIGVLYEDTGDYDRALEHYEKSLGIVEKIGDQQVIATSLHNIGIIKHYQEEYDRALEHLEKSLEISKRIGYQVGMAYNYCGMAEVYYKKGDLEKSLDLCKLACDLSQEIGFKEYIGAAKRVFGMVCREQKEWEKSIENFEESVEIYQETGMEKELGESLYEYGLMWKEKGDPDRAKDNLNKASGIFEKLELQRELDSVREALAGL